MSHTPGPWIVEKTRIGRRGPITLVMVVAEEGGMPGLIVNQGPIEPRDIANARLIAAAPDLLEALKSVVYVSADGKAFGFHNLDTKTAQTAAAAIAKAEGK